MWHNRPKWPSKTYGIIPSSPQGTDYYTMMSILLKNVGVIYQRTTTTITHDLTHNKAEIHVDDKIIKSKKRAGHWDIWSV